MNLILLVRKSAFREVETCPSLTEGSQPQSKDLLPLKGPGPLPPRLGPSGQCWLHWGVPRLCGCSWTCFLRREKFWDTNYWGR